ncbi:MAG: tRNA (adenosine(37)-N6)-threonylcarbamoyltransferase complex ATPase subunit type 1 TsaE [Candidatus Paceibacterota bacterium]
MAKHTTKSLEETHKLAADFVSRLPNSQLLTPNSCLIFALHGDLGSGKTAFVQGVAKALGVKHHVTSPTFVIQKRYEIPDLSKNIIHIDAYRLGEGSDMSALRFNETLADPNNIVFIEWPNIVTSALPEHAIPLKFKFIDETTREIELPN